MHVHQVRHLVANGGKISDQRALVSKGIRTGRYAIPPPWTPRILHAAPRNGPSLGGPFLFYEVIFRIETHWACRCCGDFVVRGGSAIN